MKKVKNIKKWSICKLNKREVAEYGFEYAVIHPENAEYMSMGILTPADTDIECETLEQAISWIENYNMAEYREIVKTIESNTTETTEEPKEDETMKTATHYSYLEAVTADVIEYIRDEIIEAEDRESLAEYLNDELWTVDGVTGNASGSYTFNRCKAREYVLADFETVAEALREFCVEADEIGKRFISEDWEYLDVTARCYVLGQAIEVALDALDGEMYYFADHREEV